MTPEEKDRIIAALEKAGARAPCPRCGHSHFTLADGYFNQPVQPDLQNFQFGGPSIPTAVTVCTKCGFVAQHAIGVLGLLPADKPQEGK